MCKPIEFITCIKNIKYIKFISSLQCIQCITFVQIYGTFTDSLNKSVQNWFPLPYVNVTGANNQINIYLDPTNINIQVGAGAPPSIAYGYIVLEFLNNV